jgi:hypothetical protein
LPQSKVRLDSPTCPPFSSAPCTRDRFPDRGI